MYLGFDYGTTNVAIGIIEGNNYRSHFMKLNNTVSPYDTYLSLAGMMHISMFYPTWFDVFPDKTYVFIEDIFKGPNANTYKNMARVAHSLDIVASDMKAITQYIGVQVWRKALFGKGNTKKEECQEWAYQEWPFLMEYKKAERGHRADALCIAEAGRLLTEEHEKKIHRGGEG